MIKRCKIMASVMHLGDLRWDDLSVVVIGGGWWIAGDWKHGKERV